VLEIVNDDMPFLVDSVLGELTERGLEVRLVVHPVFSVGRDAAGRLTAFNGTRQVEGALRESFIHIHFESLEEPARRDDLVTALERVLADVRACVTDWRAMTARVDSLVAELKSNAPPLPAAEIAEAVEFLEWLVANNFSFLGVRDYQLSAGREALEPLLDTGLGILRAPEVSVVRRWNQPLAITPEIRALIEERWPLEEVRAKASSTARRFRFADGAGEIGFVNPISEPFCSSCDRIRLTADGQLRTCLFSRREWDLKTPLREGASDEELARLIRFAVRHKELKHKINDPGFVRASRSMSQIGG
jgi:glutamate dehydrogenase